MRWATGLCVCTFFLLFETKKYLVATIGYYGVLWSCVVVLEQEIRILIYIYVYMYTYIY